MLKKTLMVLGNHLVDFVKFVFRPIIINLDLLPELHQIFVSDFFVHLEVFSSIFHDAGGELDGPGPPSSRFCEISIRA